MGNNYRWSYSPKSHPLMRSSTTVPVVLIGGYLGAGKTTFINRLLSETTERLVIIVNDFGSVNIDATLIASQNDDTIELTNGCACCTIGGSLADAMLDISDRDVQPDAVVIECSGVADPSAVSANTYIGGFHLASIITFVDAENWKSTAEDPLVKDIFWRQIDSADLLLLSKLDLVNSVEKDLLRTALQNRRPAVPLLDSHVLSPTQLLDLSPTMRRDEQPALEGPHFTSEVFSPPPSMSREDLAAYVTNLPGNVVRAKGIVSLDAGTVLVQRVGNRVVLTDTSLAPTGLVVITAD
jgi:G3E family GTPase